jgi:hypothetical protein
MRRSFGRCDGQMTSGAGGRNRCGTIAPSPLPWRADCARRPCCTFSANCQARSVPRTGRPDFPQRLWSPSQTCSHGTGLPHEYAPFRTRSEGGRVGTSNSVTPRISPELPGPRFEGTTGARLAQDVRLGRDRMASAASEGRAGASRDRLAPEHDPVRADRRETGARRGDEPKRPPPPLHRFRLATPRAQRSVSLRGRR